MDEYRILLRKENMNDQHDDPEIIPFFTEISDMMHIYGDVRQPKEESVEVVYFILREQLNALLIKADSNMNLLGTSAEKEISHKELLFLIKRNKPKLKGLLEFLYVLDMKPIFPRVPETDEDDSDEIDETVCEQAGKRVKMCNKFLKRIEDTRELSSLMENEKIVDHSARRRLMQRSAVTDRMNEQEYKEFSVRMTKATFCPRKRKEIFKEWLLKDKVTQKSVTKTALSIIDFLARETIAQIIDVALCIKSKKSGETSLVPYDQISHQFETPSSVKFSGDNNSNDEAMDIVTNNSPPDVIGENDSTKKKEIEFESNSPISNEDEEFTIVEDDSVSPCDFQPFEGDISVKLSNDSKFEDETNNKTRIAPKNSINKHNEKTSHMKNNLSTGYAVTTQFERILGNPKLVADNNIHKITEKESKYAIIPNTAITPAEIIEAYYILRKSSGKNSFFQHPKDFDQHLPLRLSHIQSHDQNLIKLYDKIPLICLQDSLNLYL